MQHMILRKTGRRSNGGERDRGPVYHAVPAASLRALCGAEPGDRSDWSSYAGDAVTCPRCLTKLAKLQAAEAVLQTEAMARKITEHALVSKGKIVGVLLTQGSAEVISDEIDADFHDRDGAYDQQAESDADFLAIYGPFPGD